MPDEDPPRRDDDPPLRRQYLAAELGHSVDAEGEPVGINNPASRSDPEMREFTLSLWRQVQTARSTTAQLREMEREGLSMTDLWAPGMTEFLPTSSTEDEMRRYKQKLLFRANLLEAILTETVADLKRLERVKPLDPG